MNHLCLFPYLWAVFSRILTSSLQRGTHHSVPYPQPPPPAPPSPSPLTTVPTDTRAVRLQASVPRADGHVHSTANVRPCGRRSKADSVLILRATEPCMYPANPPSQKTILFSRRRKVWAIAVGAVRKGVP